MSDDFEDTEVNNNEMVDLINDSKSLLKALYKKESPTTKITNQDDLRTDISSFVGSQLENLENQNIIQGLVVAELAKKITLHELDIDQLRGVYRDISSEKAKNIDSLFRLFQPTQTTPNTILTPATKDEVNDNIELSSEQRQSIEKLTRLMEIMDKRQGN